MSSARSGSFSPSASAAMRQAAEYVTKEVYAFDIYIGSSTDPENGRHTGTVFINPDDAEVRLPRPAA